MSTAKPQQSGGQPDGSDDLIAELARMMASEAKPAAPAAPDTTPEPQSASVRIPGPPETPQDAGKFDFDFGAPPKTAETLRPTPLVNWQDRLGRPAEKPAEPVRHEPVMGLSTPTPAPAPAETVAPVVASEPRPPQFTPREPVEPRVSEPEAHAAEPEHHEVPSFIAPARPAVEPPKAAPEPARQEPVAFTTHDFDFGFGTAKISEPLAQEPMPAAAAESHDAIADLIAAEFDEPAPPAAKAEEPAPQPEAVKEQPKPFLRAANFAAQPKPPGDRFAVSPVFGVAAPNKPATSEPVAQAPAPAPVAPKPAPQAPLDPMDEIESLIGSSIRHDLDVKPEARGPSSPIPAPREPAPIPRATARPIRDDHGAAEAAILAATAATTAAAVKAPKADMRAEKASVGSASAEPRQRRGFSFRPFLGPAIAAVLLVVAGGALYWVLGNNNHGTDGAAPVLTADTTPVKEPPPATPASPDGPPASVVLNELSGGDGTQTPEQLVSRDQTGDTASVAAIAPTETTGEEGLANRKVRTVTVRPDGTIVNADDALAGAEQLPVARPNVPAVPNTGLDNSDLLTAAANQPAATPSALTTTPAAAGAQPSALTPAATEQAATPIDPANITPPGTVAPVPRPRLGNRPTTAIGPQATNAVNAVVNTASNDPIGALAAAADQPQTPAPAQPAANNGGTQAAAYVQLSSQRDEAVARQSLVDINQRYGKMLGGVLPEVQRVDLGAKGIYYRVRVPTDSQQSANYLCSQIKAARGDCIVTN